MKVLFLSTLGSEYKGGGNISSSLLAEQLRERGIEVVVEYVRKSDPAGLLDRVLRAVPEGFYNTRTPLLDRLIALRVRGYVRQHRPDIVDVQDRYGVIPVSRLRLDGVRKNFTVIDDMSRDQLVYTHRRVKRFLLDLQRKAVLSRLRRERSIVANSRHTREVLLKEGVHPDSVKVVYRSLPPREWYEEDAAARPAGCAEEGGERLRFLMPGRITRGKGVPEAVSCLEGLNREGYRDRLELVMIGRGPLEGWVRERARKNAAGNLALLDPVPVREMLEHYRRADAVLLPLFNREPFGRVALEALLLGKPLVVNPCGGVKEIVEGMESGCVFVGDEQGIIRALRDLVEHPERTKEMSAFLKANAGVLKERFSHEKLCDEYEAYYAGLLAQGVPGTHRKVAG